MFFDEEDGGDAQLPSFSILARRVDDAFPTAAALFAEDLADGTKSWTPFEVFDAMRAVVSSKDLAIMVTLIYFLTSSSPSRSGRDARARVILGKLSSAHLLCPAPMPTDDRLDGGHGR